MIEFWQMFQVQKMHFSKKISFAYTGFCVGCLKICVGYTSFWRAYTNPNLPLLQTWAVQQLTKRSPGTKQYNDIYISWRHFCIFNSRAHVVWYMISIPCSKHVQLKNWKDDLRLIIHCTKLISTILCWITL